MRAEIEAVRISIPEISGIAALCSFAGRDRPIAVVSNNSGEVIRVFLDQCDLSDIVATIVGRAYRRPDLMKPNLWAITSAIESLEANRRQMVFIGGSMTDIEAAHRAGISCIAYANKPPKVQSLSCRRSSGHNDHDAVVADFVVLPRTALAYCPVPHGSCRRPAADRAPDGAEYRQGGYAACVGCPRAAALRPRDSP